MPARPARRGVVSRIVVAGCLGLVVAGCGSDGPDKYGVSGKVTVNGKTFKDLQKDVVSASISFVPEEGTPGGTTGDEINLETGEYRVKPGKGAQAGRFKIQITAHRKTGKILKPDLAGPGASAVAQGASEESFQSEEQVQFIPDKYNKSTELTFEIQKGDNEGADFDLKFDLPR